LKAFKHPDKGSQGCHTHDGFYQKLRTQYSERDQQQYRVHHENHNRHRPFQRVIDQYSHTGETSHDKMMGHDKLRYSQCIHESSQEYRQIIFPVKLLQAEFRQFFHLITMLAVSFQLSALSYQLSAVSFLGTSFLHSAVY